MDFSHSSTYTMSQLTKVHEVLPIDCSRSFPDFMKSSSAVGTIAIFGSCRSPSSIVTDIDRETRIFDFCTCCAELPLEEAGKIEHELGRTLPITDVVSIDSVTINQRRR